MQVTTVPLLIHTSYGYLVGEGNPGKQSPRHQKCSIIDIHAVTFTPVEIHLQACGKRIVFCNPQFSAEPLAHSDGIHAEVSFLGWRNRRTQETLTLSQKLEKLTG